MSNKPLASRISTSDTAAGLLAALAEGGVSLKDVAGLSTGDVNAVAKVGASALQSGRFDLAVKVFSSLLSLDPGNAQHLLHLAVAHQGAAQRELAVDALTRFLDVDLPKPLTDVARALLLRAELMGPTDKPAAARDLAAARVLAARSADVKKIVDGVL